MSAPVMRSLTRSGDFVMSFSAAIDKPQLVIGPQKCVVFGPVGLLRNVISTFPLGGAGGGGATDDVVRVTMRDVARRT